LGRAYGNYAPRFTRDGVMNVWLAEKGQAGGETFGEHIYLYDVSTHRSETEWVREVAHEYGHSTLPIVGGYAQPEYAANGRLGERLYLRWLLKNPVPKDETHSWVRALKPAELKEGRLDAPIKLFANLGPESPKLRDTDTSAMDAFVGLALYLDAANGSDFLAEVLGNINRPIYGDGTDTGFRDVLERNYVYLQDPKITAQPVIRLRTADLPPQINYWVYLYDGKWNVELEMGDDGPQPVRVELDGKLCGANAAGAYTTPMIAKGWHRLRVVPDGIIMPTLREITLTK
jgi:hypothetical protein